MLDINESIARKVLATVDAGLVYGLGKPEPGKGCVEAAVCYALGLPHGDDPQCVSRALRSLKIRLNDSRWSSDAARAKGLRRLALAQLGSRDAIDDKEFAKRCATLAIRTCVPNALRAAAALQKKGLASQEKLLAAVDLCEREPTREDALVAKAVADTAAKLIEFAADADKQLSDFAEGVVQILIEMKAPGCQWLSLTEAA